MGDPISTNSVRSPHQAAYSRRRFASNGTSPTSTFRSDFFGPTVTGIGSAQMYSTSPTAERYPMDRAGVMPTMSSSNSDPATFGTESRPAPAILIRRLPRNIASDALRSLLTFAGDMSDAELVRSPYAEDQGFATAVARFQSQAGAWEAQQKLNGKANATKEANMIVEVHSSGMAGSFERRNTIDGGASRTQSSSASSGGSVGGPSGRSRFGNAFQSSEQASPPLPTSSSAGSGEFPTPETSAHFQSLFSPQSPLANGVDDHYRVSGKSMINNDCVDDETGELLRDPVAYAQGGPQHPGRRPTNPQVPVSRFVSLSLSASNGEAADGATTSISGVSSPRNGSAMHSPMSALSPPAMNGVGTNGGFFSSKYAKHQLPPANPADQNPPCNTLYVGNLPIDTSEDELKAVFSKARGYKRLCFRTKQNGPMCFVEFEDISFATKALNDLYGYVLHNSVKGGIRLSFSKNPLGVRSGQVNGLGPNQAMNPQAMAPGYSGAMGAANFSSVSGPPPGLAAPPGLQNGGGYRPPPNGGMTGMDSMFANPFAMPQPAAPPPPQEFSNYITSCAISGGVPPTMGNGNYGRQPRHNGNGEYGGHSSPNGNGIFGGYPSPNGDGDGSYGRRGRGDYSDGHSYSEYSLGR